MFRKYISVIVLIAVLSGSAVFMVTPVQAATITVTSKLDTADPGKCRLRDAILAANFNTAVGDCTAGAAGLDTISLSLGLQCNLTPCTITLTGTLPEVTENLTINGNAATINGANAFRVFDLGAVTVNISNLKIANGNVSGISFGGAVSMSGGSVTLTNVFFSNNRAISGGAIYEAKGSLTVVNSNFSGNVAGIGGDGGAIINGSGSLSVVDSVFNNNSAANRGGAIATTSGASIINSTFSGNSASLGGAVENTSADLTVGNSVFDNNSSNFGGAIAAFGSVNIFNSTFSNNKALGPPSFGGAVYFDGRGTPLIISESSLFSNSSAFDGGAAYFQDGPVTMRNMTISGNSALNNGGGVVITDTTTANLNNVTITNNLADSDNDGGGNGGGIFKYAGTIQVRNSIVAGNYDTPGNAGGGIKNPDCSGAFSSQGFNLIGRNDGCSGFTNGANGDKVGTGAIPINPLLGALANNGGSTLTHALIPGSPAIDAGNPSTPGGGGFTCAASDQRGVARPQAAACDIGAVERRVDEVYPLVYLPAILK